MNSNSFKNIKYLVSVQRPDTWLWTTFPLSTNNHDWCTFCLPPTDISDPTTPTRRVVGREQEALPCSPTVTTCVIFWNWNKHQCVRQPKALQHMLQICVINICHEPTLASPGPPASAALLHLILRLPHSSASPLTTDPLFIHLIFPTPSCPPETRISKLCPSHHQTQRPQVNIPTLLSSCPPSPSTPPGANGLLWSLGQQGSLTSEFCLHFSIKDIQVRFLGILNLIHSQFDLWALWRQDLV